MSKKWRWTWEIYFVIFTVFVFAKVTRLILPESRLYFHLHFLTAFDPIFTILLMFCCIQVLLNILHLIPLALYIKRIPFLTPKFWQAMLILRLIFDIVGHPWEWDYLISLYYANPLLCAIITIQSLATYMPSYAACYLYAFNKEGIFK